jgi:hypothetical protein
VPLAAVAVAMALALLVVGVRQVTVALSGDDGDRSSAASAEPAGASEPAGDAPADGSVPARQDGGGEVPSAAGEPVPVEVAVGPVTADDEFGFTPPPDLVAVVAGAAAARAAVPLPGPPAPPAGSSSGVASGELAGPGTASGPAESSADPPLELAPEPFTMAASVEPDGYRAEVRVAFGGGLDGGLAALTIEFGDGTEPFVLDDAQIAAIGSHGQVSVTHTYQPTLTPQPQVATVMATDGAGQPHTRALRFDTRAAYRLSYSPLTVTALDDCDAFGKGDFKLTWQNDSSRPAGKTSTFKLGKNESYIERGFPTTVAPVHYGEFPELFQVDGSPAFFYVSLVEEDNLGSHLLEFVLGFPYEATGSAGLPDFFTLGPVAQLGTHQYPLTLHHRLETATCKVRMDFTVALTML